MEQTSSPLVPTPSFPATPNNPIVVHHKHRPILGAAFIIFALALSIIAGKLLFANHWPDTEEPVQTATPVTSATTLYTNPAYKFTVTHSKLWHSQECTTSSPEGEFVLVSFGTENPLIVCNSDAPLRGHFTVGAGPSALNEQVIASTLLALNDARRTTITIDGKEAIRVSGITRGQEGPGPQPGQTQVSIWAEQGGVLYSFIFIGESSDLPKFEQTLSTFTFGNCQYRQVQCVTTPCYPQLSCQNDSTSTIEYNNAEYGLSVTLPSSWQGYTIKTQTWQARGPVDGYKSIVATGPELRITHPLSTATSPRQDIPLMVMSLDQLGASTKEDWGFGAAPIGPSEVARNSRYAFLVPARYNYAFPVGFEEVESIIASGSVSAF